MLNPYWKFNCRQNTLFICNEYCRMCMEKPFRLLKNFWHKNHDRFRIETRTVMFDVVSNYKENRPRLEEAFYIAIVHETRYLCRFDNYGHQQFVISIRTKNNNSLMHFYWYLKVQQYQCMEESIYVIFVSW